MPDEAREFTEHFEELRKRLLTVMYFFVAALFGGFFLAKPLIYQMQNAPWTENVQMHAFQVTDPLKIYLIVIVAVAFIIILPVILYQLWSFISPGLYEKERRVTLLYIPVVMLLMLAGLAFSYFIVVPYVIRFTFDLSVEMGIETTIGINQYFGFLFRTILPFGFIFQMPVLVLFLTQLGIITPMFLRKNRKYAYFIMFVVAALIAPPDIMTHILLTVPMIILYEVSIYISKIGYRRYLKAEQEQLEEDIK
ncbi:Sec-independent protein translocase protein TatCy [Jeotgalicoccus aerolatus]|uniref:Sec-independent protein translocase protein TatC n=1 Tax=Jeotgalicoccus aerolatus TaxID=709510 RepID=A0A1G8YY66_9STAP|nr:twin-arginine translocase subunit TatC [Jeotgalicoccus aerolatus]MBP1952921.1 sec-independent protein translocase protein TatC [Jeotgalicoccus aerolatus]NMA80326.1 twin-arginine translocase subunit TatC [Jeotgalicoccus aerolatus]CAD2080192.1 Sec-independent protein translocase protein TatCy [Jeotgalicoccus aerolatus]SDK07731.1 sec-independent protein translocase protein TatC [Jeotgalicoccus aerolatus]GGE06941.1 Sec-independent protein translocase protein TatCy [Jeotgalicoccus aerolatus]